MTEKTSKIHYINLGGTKSHSSDDLGIDTLPKVSANLDVDAKIQNALPRPKSSAPMRYKGNASIKDKRRKSATSPEKLLFEFPDKDKSDEKKADAFKPPSPTTGLPVGAYTAGFYSKLRQEHHRLNSTFGGSTTLNDMIQSIQKEEKLATPKPTSPRKSISISKPKASEAEAAFAPSPTLANWLPEPDFELIAETAAVLTDIEAPESMLVESIKELIETISVETNPPGAKVLFESGIFPILMNLIPKHSNSPEVQGAICMLLKQILSLYEPCLQPFIEMGGLKYLLNASDISSKALFNQSRGPRNVALPQITVPIEEEPETQSPTEVEVLDSFRRVPIQNLTLTQGYYKKYFLPSFLTELESFSSEKRKQIFANFIDIFRKLEHLIKVNDATILDGSIYNTLETVLKDAEKMLLVSSLIIYRIDPITGDIRQVTTDPNAEIFSKDQGLVGLCSKSKDLFNLRKPEKLKEYFADIDNPERVEYVESMLLLPIIDPSGNTKGILLAVNKLGNPSQTHYFTQEDEYFFRSTGFVIAAILEKAKIYDSMVDTQKKVTVLLETTRSLGSVLDLDKLIKVIMNSAKELLTSDRCTLFLHDPERKQLRAIIQGRDSVQEIRIPQNAGIAGAVFVSGVPINIQDAYKDSRFNPEVDKQTGYVTRTILCMPIKNILGECIGVTQMINKRTGVYSAEDETILSSFSSQAAVAIEKSQLFKKTEDMRIYLQSILSSITSCVITLSESMKLNTINRPWFMNAIGIEESFMKEHSCDKWLEANNPDLYKDIRKVYETGESVYVTDFEIKGQNSLIVNYQVMPLIGSSGVVLVLDDISSEKRAVMTLGRYMSPALAKQVMEEGSEQLGGKRKKVSILFSDIRSFTTLSEDMDPPQVVELLNHHFTDAVNAITEEQGILDKFIGDAVMAVFGVPFASPDDAIHACNSALKMRDALVVTNEDRLAQGKKPIAMGIGINTGIVLSGNIGSVKRMEFSCIGDSVNLASRTEGLTKLYGVTILITENTLVDTGEAFITREIESVVVTGKKTSVRMYELIGKAGDKLDYEMAETMRLYATGLDLYRRQEFALAIEMFAEAIELSNDGPSKVLIKRAKHYDEYPPGEGWKPDYVAEGK